MKIEKFEDINAWQKSKILTLLIYKTFSNQKDYGFKDQIQRASVSVMNNVAEGFERRGDKEFKYFLSIAKGSCGEVRSMLYLGHELKYISKQEFEELYTTAVETSKMIAGLMKVLNF